MVEGVAELELYGVVINLFNAVEPVPQRAVGNRCKILAELEGKLDVSSRDRFAVAPRHALPDLHLIGVLIDPLSTLRKPRYQLIGQRIIEK